MTPRELEVIPLVARGFTAPEIAAELGITTRTVKAHLLHIRQELGVERTREIPVRYWAISGNNPFPQARFEP